MGDNTAKIKADFTTDIEFWYNLLKEPFNKCSFLYDFPLGIGEKYTSHYFQIKKETADNLLRICNRSDLKLFGLMTSALVGLLYKYTSNEDLILAVPIYKQSLEGIYNNTFLPIRTYLKSDIDFKQLVFTVVNNINEAITHQNFPLKKVSKLNNREDWFSFIDLKIASRNIHDISKIDSVFKSNFNFIYDTVDGDIGCEIFYNASVYKNETIARIATHFEFFIEQCIENNTMPLQNISLLSKDEENLINEFNNTSRDYPKDKTIIDLFEEQVETKPDEIALVNSNIKMSYRKLNNRANQIANYLISKGVTQGNCKIAILLEPGFEMIMALLAVMKSGCAFVPIDPENPVERILYQIKDSGSEWLLSSINLVDKHNINLQGLKTVYVEDETISSVQPQTNPELKLLSRDLAYIIYTSGTTGLPKGVMIEHGSIYNTIKWRKDEYLLTGNNRVLQLFKYSFDGFLTSSFTPLVSGSILYLLSNEDILDTNYICKLIKQESITHFIIIPILFSSILEILDIESAKSLEKVTLAGDKFDKGLVLKSDELNPTLELINEYGPTEASVASTILRHLNKSEVISIGRPIANMEVYITNKWGQIQPIGIAGELCLSGLGLARGYINNDTLTKEKFVSNPYKKNERLYKTGDLARILQDGNIEYLGRIDNQVKIRGFRVELGEIENQLLDHPKIKQSAVLNKEKENETYLVAYYTSEEEIEVTELRSYLSDKLPYYMVPAYFIYLEKMPLTPNGKLDRKGFPSPENKLSDKYTAPSNDIEKKLVAIWSEVLKIDEEHISANRSFFELGGHSLKATLLVNKIFKELKVEVPLREVFVYQDITSLSKYIQNAKKSKFSLIEKVNPKEYYKLSSVQKRLYFLYEFDKTSLAFNLPNFVWLEGKLDKNRLHNAFNRLIARHESLRTSFEIINDEPLQKISEHVTIKLEYSNSKENEVPGITKNFIKPFDLIEAPLLRVGLIEISPEKHILMVDMHHIISDGVSQGILIKDFMALYNKEELPELRLQYKDYAEWQQGEELQDKIVKQKSFWLSEFEEKAGTLDLPTDFRRPLIKSQECNTIGFSLNLEETNKIKSIAEKEGVTLFMVLLSVYYILLSKLSNQDDIVIGTPVAGRQHTDLENMIGMFVNTLPLRNYPKRELSFKEFLSHVKNKTLACFNNQIYQYEELINELVVVRDTSRNPLFDVMFVFQNFEGGRLSIPGLSIKPYKSEQTISKFDLLLSVTESQEQILLIFEYSIELFKKETIEKFITYFKSIITDIIKDQSKRISDIDILTEKELTEVVNAIKNAEFDL